MKTGLFANAKLYTRFILKRERVLSSIWIVALTVVVAGLVPAIGYVMDMDNLEAILPILENPAMIAMIGPAFAVGHPTLGAFYTNFMLLFTAVVVALMNVFLAVRHLRADEEQGRYEVVRSLPMGRLSAVHALMMSALIINIILSLAIGLSLWVVGDAGMGINGSLIWGAALGVVGFTFAAIAALFSQLCASSRGAMGYSFAALFLLYLIRTPGDLNADHEIISLINPLGLVLRAQPYIMDYWWPIVVLFIAASFIFVLAYRFNVTRDIGQGLIPARPGRAHGSFLVKTSGGLTVKLLRTSVIAWLLGVFILGASYASVFGEIDDFIANNDMYQQLILGPAGVHITEGLTPEQTVAAMRAAVAQAGFTMTELFSSMVGHMMGMMTMVPLVMFVLVAKSEEGHARTELILATRVHKASYLAGFAVIAFIAAVVLQFTLGLGLYLVGSVVLADPSELTFGFVMRANLVYVPALWVMVGLTVFIIGFVPKLTVLLWGYFAFIFISGLFGRMDIFPEWINYLSPFGFVPQLPMDEINWLTLSIMREIAVILTLIGLLFYRRRDINAITT